MVDVVFPPRNRLKPYVVVVYRPDESELSRGYVLGGNYNLLDREASEEQIEGAIAHHVSSWHGWVPTGANQRPLWAAKLEQTEGALVFTAYWVAK